jgi:serine/threonine protein kinase
MIYKIGTEIGTGKYGSVKMAEKHCNPRKKYAVKQIPRGNHDRKLLEQELSILNTVNHPNIVNFYEIYKDKSHFHIVTEFCEGGELYSRIIENGTLSEV